MSYRLCYKIISVLNSILYQYFVLCRRSLEEFSKLEEARGHCFSLCSRQRSKVTSRWAELNFFGLVLERSHCVRHCTEEEVGLLPREGVALTIVRALQMREGLSFLQSAYHEVQYYNYCVCTVRNEITNPLSVER